MLKVKQTSSLLYSISYDILIKNYLNNYDYFLVTNCNITNSFQSFISSPIVSIGNSLSKLAAVYSISL